MDPRCAELMAGIIAARHRPHRRPGRVAVHVVQHPADHRAAQPNVHLPALPSSEAAAQPA